VWNGLNEGEADMLLTVKPVGYWELDIEIYPDSPLFDFDLKNRFEWY